MSNSSTTRTRRLFVLGSTGSIGCNTLNVVETLNASDDMRFDIVGLATGTNVQQLGEQIKRFHVEYAAVADGERAASNFSHSCREVFTGSDAAQRMIERHAQRGDLVVGAMVGAAGIPATLAAIDRGCDIALANKETLAAAGQLVMPHVKKTDVHLIPVDSEHSAIFQCLQAGRSMDEVRRVVITASGGPFRNATRKQINRATVDEALAHPTWNMGAKNTVDSATMMNKALEILEAHWLFNLPPEKIDVIVHPQSIVHSFVEFVDGAVFAQLSPPNMKLPIQYALTWPDRLEGSARTMNWAELRSLDFESVDHDRFPAIHLAHQVIEAGGTAGAVFNAANEQAVTAFLAERIALGDIAELVAQALREFPPNAFGPANSLDAILTADAAARQFVDDHLARTEQSAFDAGNVRETAKGT